MSDWLWRIKEAFGNPEYHLTTSEYHSQILAHPLIKNVRVAHKFFLLITNSMDFTNENVEGDPFGMTGFTPGEIIDDNQFLFRFTHKDDLPFIIKVVEAAMKYTMERPKNEREYIGVTYFYRAISKKGKNMVISHESIPMIFDNNQIPYIFCNVLSDLTFLRISKLPQATLVNHYRNQSFQIEADNLKLQDTINLFTKRELEIIDLLIKGLSSRKIGEKLFISPETVRTHRRNILKKAQIHSTAELVSFVLSHRIGQ